MQSDNCSLGHFALTGLLLPLLVKSKKARVVTVSSIYHKPGKINFDDLHFKKSYKPYDAYAASKLANLLFTKELQRLFDQKGITNVISVAAHPGYTATNLQSSGPAMPQWFINPLNTCFGMRLEKGALSQIYAAVSEEVEKGGYYGPDGFYEIWGYPGRAQEAPAANDQETAKKLWEVSEQLTGVKYQL
jgi:NAD(P)-dependent dehydrogenase (short-subunit alcohol dehydrogenase family)